MRQSFMHISKFMSLVLRHRPATINLQPDENGWVNVQELIEKMNKKGMAVDLEKINAIVATNDKQRFAFNADRTMIRASQGHSIAVELNLPESIPPSILYHGTTDRFLESIFSNGLQRQQRQHVHLSATAETAAAVGSRHGKPVILSVLAKAMQEAGFVFYLSANKVWLTDAVPPQYIIQ